MAAPLSERDVNLAPTSQPAQESSKPQVEGEENTTQQHKQVASHKLLETKSTQSAGQATGTYISPSDSILSPATKKLADFKQRAMNKSTKSPAARTLFARTVSGCSSGGLGEGEAEQEGGKNGDGEEEGTGR